MAQHIVIRKKNESINLLISVFGLISLMAGASVADVKLKADPPAAVEIPKVSQVCTGQDSEKICTTQRTVKESQKKFTYVHK